MPTAKQARAARDRQIHPLTKAKGKTAKRPHPNIETKPSRSSGAIRTPDEQAQLEARESKRTAKDTPPVQRDTSEGKGKTLGDVKQGVQRTIRKTPQKALVAELLAAVLLTAIREVADGNSPGIEPFVGSFVVYLILGFAAEVGGDQTARVAAAIGGLVLLAIAARTVGPLITAGRTVANPHAVTPIAGPGSGVRTMGPHGGVGGSPRRPPARSIRGNNLSNPTGG